MDLVGALAQIQLCAELEQDELQRLAAAGRVERWSEQALVMEEGEHGPRLAILLEGHVMVRKRDETGTVHRIGEVGPGGVLGEISLLTGTQRSATVVALGNLKIFAIDRSTFEAMVADGDPAVLKLGLAIARVLAQRLCSVNDRVVELLEEHTSAGPVPDLAALRRELFTRWNF